VVRGVELDRPGLLVLDLLEVEVAQPAAGAVALGSCGGGVLEEIQQHVPDLLFYLLGVLLEVELQLILDGLRQHRFFTVSLLGIGVVFGDVFELDVELVAVGGQGMFLTAPPLHVITNEDFISCIYLNQLLPSCQVSSQTDRVRIELE
jgi:hypothetical protein